KNGPSFKRSKSMQSKSTGTKYTYSSSPILMSSLSSSSDSSLNFSNTVSSTSKIIWYGVDLSNSSFKISSISGNSFSSLIKSNTSLKMDNSNGLNISSSSKSKGLSKSFSCC